MKYTIKLTGADIYTAIYKDLAAQAIERAAELHSNGLDRNDYLRQVLRGVELALSGSTEVLTVDIDLPELFDFGDAWPNMAKCKVAISVMPDQQVADD